MWPFTRKPKPINPGPINEDWRVGDLAECVTSGDGSDWRHDLNNAPAIGPAFGDVRRVQAVFVGQSRQLRRPLWWLVVNGIPANLPATCFRKVPPLNSEASAEFTAQIRKLAHRKAPAA
jgi:hypothetical protein